MGRGVAQALFQRFALGDEARGILRRPGEQQRRLDVQDAGERRSLVVLVRIRAEIGFFLRAGVCARAVNAGHQNRCSDVGIGNLKFRVGQQACHVKCADGVADRHDLVAVAAE